jgi:hypothetical protein
MFEEVDESEKIRNVNLERNVLLDYKIQCKGSRLVNKGEWIVSILYFRKKKCQGKRIDAVTRFFVLS